MIKKTFFLIIVSSILFSGAVLADTFDEVNTNRVNATSNVTIGTGNAVATIDGDGNMTLAGVITATGSTLLNPHLMNYLTITCDVGNCMTVYGDVYYDGDVGYQGFVNMGGNLQIISLSGDSIDANGNIVTSADLHGDGVISDNEITLDGETITSWDDVNKTGGGSSLWTNESGTASYSGPVNISGNLTTDYLGLLGYNPSYPIHYEGEPGISRLISLKYGDGSPASSPFYYDAYIPQTTSTGTQIMAIVNARVYSERTSAGSQYLYGNYVKVGGTYGVRHLTGTQYYTYDDVDIGTPNGGFMVASSANQEFKGHDYNLNHGLSLASESGSEYIAGGYTKYQTKANNALGGSRTYETYGYHAEDFSGCQAYDTCYAFYADNSDSKFDGSVILTSGDKICLDGDTCNHWLKYNGTCIESSSGSCI